MFLALGDKNVILFFASWSGVLKVERLPEGVAGYMGPFPCVDVSDELSEALLVPDELGQRLPSLGLLIAPKKKKPHFQCVE